MKRIILLMMCIFYAGLSTVYAQTSVDTGSNNDFGVGIYGDINADMVYTYGTHTNYANTAFVFSDGYHSLGTQNFMEDSYLGIDLKYKNIGVLLELGLADYVRKYVISYNFGDKYGQHISVGRNDTLAHYQLGQVLNGYQGMTNYGALNADNRRLQVRYGIENFEAALIFPYLGADYKYANDNGYYTTKNNNTFLGFAAIPRLEAAYTYKHNNILSLKAFASYGAYVYSQEYTYKKDVVHTASIGAGGRYIWLNKGFFDFTTWTGLNLYQTNALTANKLNPVYGYFQDDYEGTGFINTVGHTDIINFGVGVAVGYEFEALGIKYIPQIGMGYMLTYADILPDLDHDAGVYGNVVIRFNDYIDLIPEIAFLHDITNGYNQDEGYNITFGVNARFRF